MRILWSTIPLFRVAGVPVRIATAWAVYPLGVFLLWGWLEDGRCGGLYAIRLVAIAYGCILIHEFAHVLVARCFGCGTQKIVIFPLGCIAWLKRVPPPAQELWVAAAGPLASAAL